MHESRFGKIVQDEREWFPTLHLEFLDSVRQVSTFDFITTLPPGRENRI